MTELGNNPYEYEQNYPYQIESVGAWDVEMNIRLSLDGQPSIDRSFFEELVQEEELDRFAVRRRSSHPQQIDVRQCWQIRVCGEFAACVCQPPVAVPPHGIVGKEGEHSQENLSQSCR
jgi:hypothetical protein